MISSSITIRKGIPDDLPEMKQVFTETITTVCCADYTPAQIAVWVAGAEDSDRWQEIMAHQVVRILDDGGKMAGFATLARGSYIDLFYIHKDYQRQGLARRLFAEIEQTAISMDQLRLTSDVSITARPFFERMGFVVLKEQKVMRQGVELTNFRMEKTMDRFGAD
jgi:putative acetyltransferase